MAKRKREQAAPATIKGGTGLKMRPGTYTGDDVLQWVIRKVKEEPKRLYMSDWVVLFKGRAAQGYWIRAKDKPRCGTAACMAGWAGIATGNAHLAGTWDGLNALGLQNPKLPSQPLLEAQNDFSSLFMMTQAPKEAVIRRAQDLAERHNKVLQAAKVTVKAGWQKVRRRA